MGCNQDLSAVRLVVFDANNILLCNAHVSVLWWGRPGVKVVNGIVNLFECTD